MEQCIRSLAGLDYPRDRFEVLFADGRSTDRTRELAKAGGHTVVDNPGLKISSGRDVGFAAATGDIIAFTDADCLFPANWVRNAVEHFRRHPEVGGLGGPTPVPPNQESFGRAVGMVFDLAGMGGGTVHVSAHAEPRLVSDLPGCNCFYRREALARVMPMNSVLFSNEDVEMNAALHRRGVTLLMTPDVSVQHYKRSSRRKFWKQMVVFAIGRLQLGKRDLRFLRPAHWLMGVGFPLVLLILPVFLLMDPWLGVSLLGAGLAAAAVILARVAIATSFRTGLDVITALMIFLLAWPLGFLRELFFPMKIPVAVGKPTSRD